MCTAAAPPPIEVLVPLWAGAACATVHLPVPTEYFIHGKGLLAQQPTIPLAARLAAMRERIRARRDADLEGLDGIQAEPSMQIGQC